MSSNLKVLVADDNPDHVQLITEILNQELKAAVEDVTKGEKCLEKVKKTRYDLLLLDYLFPEITGMDILKEIVEKNYDLPVIMLTGHGSEKVAVEAMKAGAIDYIVKSEDGFQSLPFVAKKAIEKDQLKKKLRQSEEKFKNIFDNASDNIIYLDTAGRILEVNKQAVGVCGRSKQEMLGKHFTGLGVFSLGELPTLMNNFADVLAGKEVNVNVCIKNKRGQEITLECSASLIKTDDKVSGVMVIARDITERKQREEEQAYQIQLHKFRSEMTYSINRQLSLREILQQSTEVIMRNLDIACAQIWIMNREINSLELQAHAGLSTLCTESDECIQIGNLLASRVVAAGQSIASNSILDKPLLIDDSWARNHNIVAYAGLPLFAQSHLLGVLTVFASRLPLERILSPLAGSAITLAQGIMRKQAEEALQESEERYRSLVESSADPIYLIDRNLKYLFANNKFLSRLGKSLNEVVGQDYFQFHSPDETKEFSAMIEKVFKSGKPISYEHKSQRDGREFIRTLSPIKDPKTKKITAVTVISKDITKRKRAEEALRASEAQLSNAMEIAKLGYWEYDVAEDIFTFNDHFYEIFRTTAEKVGGYKMSSEQYARQFIHPDDRSVVGSEIRKAIETTDPNFSRQLEHRIIYPDGEIGYVSARFFIVKDSHGRTVKTYGANQDITEHKLAEEEITKLAKFPAEDPEPVMRLNNDGTILNANKACDSLLIDWGWKRGKKVPKCWRDLLSEVLEKRTTRIIEMQSAEKVFSFFFVPIAEAKYVNLYGRDITELKSTENALLHSEYMLRRLREHTEEIVEEERHRISQIIHDDLGQRLTGLMMDLESIKWELAKYVKIPSSYVIAKIDDMNVSIQTLVDRVRKISTEVRPAVLDDLGLSAAIRWEVREFTKRSNVHCMFKSVPKDIALNPRQNFIFFRILCETLTNITRHAEARNVKIRLIQTHQSVTLEICDDGKGMNDQTIVSSESLGIYSMRERAQSIGAQFSIKSERGKGTAITVVLSGAEN